MATATARKSVGEIESFVTMLRAACSDEAVYQRLEQLLSLADSKRQALVRAWVSDLLIAGAPQDFVQAVGCLADDRVAEKAYEVIYQCRTGAVSRTAPSRFRRWLVGVACGLALLALVLISILLFWPAPRFYELDPAATMRQRSPACSPSESWSMPRAAR